VDLEGHNKNPSTVIDTGRSLSFTSPMSLNECETYLGDFNRSAK